LGTACVYSAWKKQNQFTDGTFRWKMRLNKVFDILVGNGLFSIKKGGGTMQAYCVKCRAKREMKDTKAIVMKNGKPATQGVCPTCGTKMFRIGKS